MSTARPAEPGAEAPDGNPDKDPEIAALLEFGPVPRKRNVDGGWTPELQREFIARLAVHGSPGRACEEMGKDLTGMTKLYRSPLGASFRAAWDGAVALARRRQADSAAKDYVAPGARPPTIDHRFKRSPSPLAGEGRGEGAPGQVRNEHGEWEDERSFGRRGQGAIDRIRQKLLRARRLYLQEICGSGGKRAAFEILTELPIDWEKAERLEAQADEPWNLCRMRAPDMVLTAESGWSFGEIGYGPDKKAEIRKAIDAYRAEEGLPPINWNEEE